ncbi:MAG: hypothetical protein CMI18_12260 [Opitutaceae bacterium]|nr:hypothetical protein [Opitutaceae bacterium]
MINASTEYPSGFNGNRIKSLESISLLSYIQAKETEQMNRSFIASMKNHSSIRSGDWNLVTNNDHSDEPWELYNFSDDRCDVHNVASQLPEIAEQLHNRWMQWARDVNAIPFPENR